ncbi:MAG TPA: hypothetical protein VK543_07175 [Puia sp.]|nr:hypothetical protein [Puia sp.]
MIKTSLRFPFKAFLLLLACSFFMLNRSEAQSIVGKWERTPKLFVTDKASGKQVPASADMQKQYSDAMEKNGYKETLEMKTDNSYISSVETNGEKPRIHEGNYSLSGNQLEMNIPLVKGQKTMITIQSLTKNLMIWNIGIAGRSTTVEYVKM